MLEEVAREADIDRAGGDEVQPLRLSQVELDVGRQERRDARVDVHGDLPSRTDVPAELSEATAEVQRRVPFSYVALKEVPAKYPPHPLARSAFPR